MQRDTKSHPAENQAEDEGERETRQESKERRLGVDDRDGDSDSEDEKVVEVQ
jgi:ribosomal protein L27